MKPSLRIGLLGVLLLGVACGRSQARGTLSAALEQGELVDLTHAFDQTTLYWPTDTSGFRLTSLAAGPTPDGYFYAASSFTTAEHGGTHLDAPFHFAEQGSTVERIPLARLIAPAVVIDMRQAAERNPDALLDAAQLAAFERERGPIEAGTIVLVLTGWSARWPDRKRYLGDDTPGAVSNLHFPGISSAAAAELVARRVAAVGIDTASIDHGPSRDFAAHRVLLGAEIPAFENLMGLERLPARGAWLFALPMKIAGGTGGPLRAVAVLPRR